MNDLENASVRLMFPRDLSQVLDIEERKPGQRWQQHDFLPVFLSYHTDGWVAEANGEVVGFMVFKVAHQEERPATITILNLIVAPYWRRRGIASGMVEHLCEELMKPDSRLRSVVPESDLATQLFLRAKGFEAIRVLRGRYGDQDAYLFERRCEKLSAGARRRSPATA